VGSLWIPLLVSLEVVLGGDVMGHWFGCRHPCAWHGYGIPDGYVRGGYGFGCRHGAMSRDERPAIVQEEKRCVSR
jgi:hypothetical protein